MWLSLHCLAACLPESANVDFLLFDKEPGWFKYTQFLSAAIKYLAPSSTAKWGGRMDLTLTVDHPVNATLRAVAPGLDVILVVAACEALRPAYGPPTVDTVFFRSLLPLLKVGTLLVFVEPQFNVPNAVQGLTVGNKRFSCPPNHPAMRFPGVAGIKLLQVRGNLHLGDLSGLHAWV
jgi:hypothetical protein